MSRGACPAVRTLELQLKTAIPFLSGKYKEVNKTHLSRLQIGGNVRHQMGVCLDIILFAQDWSRYDKSVDYLNEMTLGEHLVKTFVELKDEMKWTEIIYEDRLFWEPEKYVHYGKDRKHFTHIHIDWMTNNLKGKGKSEHEIIKNSPQANHTGFAAPLTSRLFQINQMWENKQLPCLNLAAVRQT